jgi:hypothetical protein
MWESLINIVNRWDFTILLFVLILAVRRWTRIGPYASALLFPSGLLLVRKLALFIPVCGSISTEDHVYFWSTSSYWYAFVFVLLNGLIVAGIRFRERVNWKAFGCLYFIVSVILIVGSAILLPLSGFSHVYSPVVAFVAASKIMLVSRLLLPIAWLTLLLQIGVLIFARGVGGREINKLALACIVVSGLLHFSLQQFVPTPAIVSEIDATWNTEAKTTERTTRNFLRVWANKLPQISELHVNIVEKQIPYSSADEAHTKVVLGLNSWWRDLWPDSLPRNVLLIGLGCLLLLTASERLPIGDKTVKRKSVDNVFPG